MRKILKISLVFISINLICCNNLKLESNDFQRIEVADPVDMDLSNHIKVYRDSIRLELDKTIGYSEKNYSKADYNNRNFNSSLGNLIADILFVQSDSVLKKKI